VRLVVFPPIIEKPSRFNECLRSPFRLASKEGFAPGKAIPWPFERRGRGLSERGVKPKVRVSCATIAFAVGMAVLVWPALERKVYLLDDLANYHLPIRAFYAHWLKEGVLPLWCPNIHCGFDLHGEGQAGMLHPWHLLLYRFLPLDVAFNLEAFASMPFLFAGMAILLRRLGLSPAGGDIGALLATFGGFTLPHVVHLNALAIIAHLPWMLLCLDEAQRGRMARAAGGIGLLTGSMLLLGYPQYVWLCGLVEVAFLLGPFRTAPAWKAFLVGKMLGIAIGAVQVVPTWDALKLSERAETTAEFRADRSLPPARLLQVFWRGVDAGADPANPMLSLEYSCYFGLAVPIAVAWGILGGALWRTSAGRLGAALGALGLLLALGDRTPLFHLYAHLPLVDSFRAPCRYLLLAQIGFALAGAASLSGVRSRLLMIGLAVFATADLLWYSVPYLRHMPPDAIDVHPEVQRAGRVWMVPHGLGPIAQGWRLTNGYVGLPPARNADPQSAEFFRVSGTAWRMEEDVRLTPTGAAPAPRAELQSLGRDGRRMPIPGSSVRIMENIPGLALLETDAASSALLFWNESYHPGWLARIDGAPAETLRVGADFLGVYLPEGKHRVELRFMPRFWNPSLAATGAGSLTGFLLLLAGLRRPKREQVGEHDQRPAGDERPA
jgi:hypothetical protein